MTVLDDTPPETDPDPPPDPCVICQSPVCICDDIYDRWKERDL